MEENKINLLIVDDEEPFLESTRKRLETRGFEVICVDRGDRAIKAARWFPIDIALVDLRMPGMSGEETLKILKQENEYMEVVILTDQNSIDSAVECTKSGAYSYLQKPCELEHLLEVLKDAYKKKVLSKMIQQSQMDDVLQRGPVIRLWSARKAARIPTCRSRVSWNISRGSSRMRTRRRS